MNPTRTPVLVVSRCWTSRSGSSVNAPPKTASQFVSLINIPTLALDSAVPESGFQRSLEVFNFLDVPEVNDLGKLVPLNRSYKPGTLEPLADTSFVPYIEPSPTIPFHAPKLIGQQFLDVILRRHLEKFSCSVEMGTELRSFEQSDEGVTAVLEKNGISETFHTNWVIGADGAKGVMRKQLGLAFLGETRDELRMVLGDKSAPDTVVKVLAPIWKLHGTRSEELTMKTIASLIPTEVTFNKFDSVNEFRCVLVTSIRFQCLLVYVYFMVNIRMVNKFSDGRGFVVGDAAHVHSPAGGQGLNSAIQDAFNLGWKLALVEKGLADKSLLETYNSERLPVISEMLQMTTALLNVVVKTDKMHAQSPILSMLGINYRFSNIVLDEFAIPGKPINAYGILDEGNLEAGDRAPDAPNMLQVGCGESGVKTLFGLYRPSYHTVLVFAPSVAGATPILGALEAYDNKVVRSAVVLPSSATGVTVAPPVDLALIDQEGHAYSAYLVEAGQTKVLVIRPDGVVGAIVRGAEGVKKYFSRIFSGI
ncbi:hypothetical protein BDR04DRAFT_1160187 [Suillus decipiens]|nr:hypothetical protein BDR04DRAFT_1160187 [Suillus decipiens]